MSSPVRVTYRYNCFCGTNWRWPETVESIKPDGQVTEGILANVLLTTRPYPLEAIESVAADGRARRGGLTVEPQDSMKADGALIEGELRVVYQSFDDWPPESVKADGELISGALQVIYQSYENYPPDSVKADGQLMSGELKAVLITYPYWPAEAVNADGAVHSGVLE